MGLERYEWKKFETEDPQGIIDNWQTWGWRVYSIRDRERVIRSHHSGTSINSSTGSGSLGSYGGTTTLEREYWTELILVRDPRDPNYQELVQLERTWKSPGPSHRVVRPGTPPMSKLETIGGSVALMVMVFLALLVPVWLLGFWPAFDHWRDANMLVFSIIYAGLCLPFGLFALWGGLQDKGEPGDEPLTEAEKREWNRKGAEHTKKRYAALERAQQLTGTR